jgi:hypothetical protein
VNCELFFRLQWNGGIIVGTRKPIKDSEDVAYWKETDSASGGRQV